MSNENESVPVTQLKVYSKEGTLISTLELKDASYVIGPPPRGFPHTARRSAA